MRSLAEKSLPMPASTFVSAKRRRGKQEQHQRNHHFTPPHQCHDLAEESAKAFARQPPVRWRRRDKHVQQRRQQHDRPDQQTRRNRRPAIHGLARKQRHQPARAGVRDSKPRAQPAVVFLWHQATHPPAHRPLHQRRRDVAGQHHALNQRWICSMRHRKRHRPSRKHREPQRIRPAAEAHIQQRRKQKHEEPRREHRRNHRGNTAARNPLRGQHLWQRNHRKAADKAKRRVRKPHQPNRGQPAQCSHLEVGQAKLLKFVVGLPEVKSFCHTCEASA